VTTTCRVWASHAQEPSAAFPCPEPPPLSPIPCPRLTQAAVSLNPPPCLIFPGNASLRPADTSAPGHTSPARLDFIEPRARRALRSTSCSESRTRLPRFWRSQVAGYRRRSNVSTRSTETTRIAPPQIHYHPKPLRYRQKSVVMGLNPAKRQIGKQVSRLARFKGMAYCR
jgi:hypothetical protein